MATTLNTKVNPRYEIRIEDIDVKWGDIVFVDFGKGIGSEQGGVRPAIVVQNNKGNSVSPCTVVVPVTSEEKHRIPTHITLYPNSDNGLTKISTAMCEQIRTIDKSRIKSKIGHIDMDMLVNRIQQSLSIAFSKNYC